MTAKDPATEAPSIPSGMAAPASGQTPGTGRGPVPLSRPPAFSLPDLEAFDPRGSGGGRERRFCCPLPACRDKARDRAHQSLGVNLETGAWLCYRCKAAGKLVERWRPAREHRQAVALRSFRLSPEPQRGRAATASQLPALWATTTELPGTPGAIYLHRRGIPPDVAVACGVRFARDWMGAPAVIFPLHDQAGELVAANGRYLSDRAQPKTRTVGDLKLGTFATPGAWEADPLVLVEGPCDALALYSVAIRAVALVEARPPAWLARRTFGRQVAVATDADTEGDAAAAREIARLGSLGAMAFRWRPPEGPGVKDWGDVAKPANGGLDALWALAEIFLNGCATPVVPG